eukprot:PITA_13600
METLLKFKATAVLLLVNILVMLYCNNEQIPHGSIKEMSLMKLVQTSFYHMNHIHFTYNTVSLICKGMQLEPLMGSAMFGFTVLVLAFLSHSLIAIVASMSEYAYPAGSAQVGFSAVVVSLKVLVNKLGDHLHGGLNDVFWMEALVVPFLFPDRSVIVGIFCGVLAGYIYLYIKDLFVWFCTRNLGGARPESSDHLIWLCPSCGVRNGVFLTHCHNCHLPRVYD